MNRVGKRMFVLGLVALAVALVCVPAGDALADHRGGLFGGCGLGGRDGGPVFEGRLRERAGNAGRFVIQKGRGAIRWTVRGRG